jgi:hypothetical protein
MEFFGSIIIELEAILLVLFFAIFSIVLFSM